MNEFHWLRPWWLLALIPCGGLIWRLYTLHDPILRWRQLIAPQLLPHLLIHAEQRHRASPLALLSVCWLLIVLALAGPTWQREPAPFGDDTAVLAIVLKVTPSMLAEDIQPTRLARSVQKIHDLLAQRPAAKTSLIAYSGSAHQVLPFTTDAAVLSSLAAELSPGVMPKEGDSAAAALRQAGQMIAHSGSRGWILWIADTVSSDQLAALQQPQTSPTAPATLLAVASYGPERQALMNAATTLQLPVVNVTPDDTDVNKLAANTRFSTSTESGGDRWRDSGYWLVPILSALCLGWFRRGWMIGDVT